MTDFKLILSVIAILFGTLIVSVMWKSVFITMLEPLGIVKKNSAISQWSFGKKMFYVGSTYIILFLISSVSSGEKCFTCSLVAKESGMIHEKLGTECGPVEYVASKMDSMRSARSDEMEKHNLTINCE